MHWSITNDTASSSEFFFDSPYNETYQWIVLALYNLDF